MFQMPLTGMVPTSDWKAPEVHTLPSWRDAKRVGIDIETCDPDLVKLGPGVRRDGFIAGVSFAIDDGPKHYLPMRHLSGGNLDPDKVMDYLADQTKTFTGDLLLANAPYDLDYLAEDGVWFSKADICDIQVSDALIWEWHPHYDLDSIARRRGLEGKNEVMLLEMAKQYNVHPKKDLWKLPAWAVAEYAIQDAAVLNKIMDQQNAEIDEQEGLRAAWELEQKVTPVLVKMTRRGIPVDLQKVSQIEKMTLEVERECWAIVKSKTGVSIKVGDAMKAAAIAPALQYLGIKLGRTKNKQQQIDKDLLKASDHPVTAAILRAREYSKLRTTYCAGVRKCAVRGRVHPTYNQTPREDSEGKGIVGATTFRLSAKTPSVQNQPTRHPEFGKLWRSVYLPEPGERWVILDFSQQEPKMGLHYAVLSKLPGAAEMAQRFRDNPFLDVYQPLADLTGIDRELVKQIVLAFSYGQGDTALCAALGYETETKLIHSKKGGPRYIRVAGKEGQAFIDRFNAVIPYIKGLATKAKHRAIKHGLIRTLMGHISHFRKDADGNYDFVKDAYNKLAQMSAAGQTKKAMVDMDEAGLNPFLQVHDELDLSLAHERDAMRGAIVMRDCTPQMLVPSRVTPEVGDSWGTAKACACKGVPHHTAECGGWGWN